jgi:predicted ATPase/class 3 adenylate cyclase
VEAVEPRASLVGWEGHPIEDRDGRHPTNDGTCQSEAMSERPSGAVTFLFTDIEGSTRLWEAQPADMARALARHDAVVREAIDARDGYVFSTAGDAFGAAFAEATAGAAAAVATQRALQREPWPQGAELRVRMGLHTGETVERDGDYFGPTLNRCARVMAAAHGGQVLVTRATERALGGHVDGAELADLGEHHLRDLEGTEHLFQLTGDGLAAEFPPVRSLDAAVSTLPPQRSSFVGRDDEMARTRALLRESRLVTLTGAGGCGKTRLAVEVAAREIAMHPDGTFFVDLSRVGDDAGVAGAFATGLDFVPEADAPVARQVRERIGRKRALLVVDNCEHVLDEVAEELEELLTACPEVRVLATSREALDVEGERTYRVPSLAVDAADGRPASARLFLERAAEAGVELGPADDASIADICRRLDGLPLAIELAAARTGVLSPAQILERLDDRFALLTGGRRRTRGRQQTLEATIDWSYDLLEAAEQDALRRLSVMPGRFDLDLAAAVLDRPDAVALDMLDALVARSLVHTERADSGQVRYRLLETIRVYAHERLVDAEAAEETRDKHAARVAARLSATDDPVGFSVTPSMDELSDDAIAALEWAEHRGDRTLVGRLACSAAPIFVGRGLIPSGRAWLELGAQVDDPMLASEVLGTRSALEMIAGDLSLQVRLAGESLKVLGDRPAPWRSGDHCLRAIVMMFDNPERAAEEVRQGRAELMAPMRSAESFLDLVEACLLAWRGQVERARDVAAAGSARVGIDETVRVLAASAHLLAQVLVGDEPAVESSLLESSAEQMRYEWLERTRRGEQWFATYEVVRAFALAALGDLDRARRDLAATVAPLSGDRLVGLDADFLGVFAWACLIEGDTARAHALLDDTFWMARSPVTMNLLYEVLGRLHGQTGAGSVNWRVDEVRRRIARVRDVAGSQDRARRMIDDELARLGLNA